MSFPRATVRLQLHSGFSFADAAAQVDYYAQMGISHYYLSPIFAARKGSTHGYDVCDPTTINPELGGERGLLELSAALRAAGMGMVIDIVPNHMGVIPGANRYWDSVLTWGPGSPYARWFDIDWDVNNARLKGKVLLPVLGDPYDLVMESGQLKLVFERTGGCLQLAYHDQRMPLSLQTQAEVMGSTSTLAEPARLFANANPRTAEQAGDALLAVTSHASGMAALESTLPCYDSRTADGRERLHALLDRQHYRLSWWRNAAEEINWRRFFEVTELAGVRVETDAVFEPTHALILDLYRRGVIDGVRVDHVDGLADPARYCRQLRARLCQLQPERPAPHADEPPWVIVEKILSPGEALPGDWEVDGTTGYDFMDQVGRLLHEPSGEKAMRNLWGACTGDARTLDEHVQAAREQLTRANFGGEVDALTHAVYAYALSLPNGGRDVAQGAIKRVLQALLAAGRRYRSYSHAPMPGQHGTSSDEDRDIMARAATAASRSLQESDHDLLREVSGWLCWPAANGGPRGDAALRARAITRFQQLTPPLAAKSVEDTAFYRYGPVLSRNEVGSYPDGPGGGIDEFHRANVDRAARWPRSMVATATHDHKRGEDVRARLAVLCDCPGLWEEFFRRWMNDDRSEATTQRVSRPPSVAERWMLLQTLVGSWPVSLKPEDSRGIAAFSERVAAWQIKALREAKQHTSWLLPQPDYEAACQAFLQRLLTGKPSARFASELATLVGRLQAAADVNSLTQTLLRLTSPGVPDLYQGTELADLSLVDPDNRRPVDMGLRRARLERLGTSGGDAPQPDSPDAKQCIVARVLNLRRQHPALFAEGDYAPLSISGSQRQHVVAFSRKHRGSMMLVVATVRPGQILQDDGSTIWGDTRLHFELPISAGDRPGSWRDLLGHAADPVRFETDDMPVQTILRGGHHALFYSQPDRAMGGALSAGE